MQFPFPIGHEQRVFLCLQPPPRGRVTSRFAPCLSQPSEEAGRAIYRARGGLEPGSHPAAAWGKLHLGSGTAPASPGLGGQHHLPVTLQSRFPQQRDQGKSHRVRRPQELIQASGVPSLQKMGLGGTMEEGLQSVLLTC